MTANFSDLPWHDSELIDLFVDRRRPGEADQVNLTIKWTNDEKSVLRFLNCYGMNATMNFGIIAAESILIASVTGDGEDLTAIRRRWAVINVDLSDLKRYEIQTNSTASKIIVYALNFDTGS